MRKTAALSAFAGLALVACSAMADPVNVAKDKPVYAIAGSLNGNLATVTDGLHLPESTQWQTNTVWWHGNATIEIDLGEAYTLFGANIQCDDNDSYRLDYFDASDSSWKTLWNVPNYDPGNWGMTTRPYPGGIHTFSPVTTDKVRFTQQQGDNCYSVSEIQLYGCPVIPLPASLWGGLVLAGVAAARRVLRN